MSNKPCVDYLGNNFDSVKAMCRYHQVKYRTYLARKNKGWSLKRILDSERKNGHFVIIRGQRFNSFREAERSFGLKKGAVKRRYRLGYRDEGLIINHQKLPVSNGVLSFDSIAEASKKLGISYNTLSYRLQTGKTPF